MPGYTSKRFVVSFRDKSQYTTAFEKESMMDETTGELLTKTQAGDILSYDYYKRLKRHTNEFTEYLLDRSLKGDIFNITPSSALKLPAIISSNTELLDESVSLMGVIKKFALSVDADIVISNTTENAYNKSYNDYSLTYTYELYYLGTVISTGTVTTTQNNIFTDFITVPNTLNPTKLKITSIKVNNLLSESGVTYKIILNSIELFASYEVLSGLIGISIDTLPTKLVYEPMDVDLDLDGMVVHAYYADDTFVPIDDYTTSGWLERSSSDTVVPITVSYEGYSDSFNVSIPSAGFIYSIDSNEVTILRYVGSAQVVDIPTEIESCPVKYIEGTAFSYTNVTSVTIPVGVTIIG